MILESYKSIFYSQNNRKKNQILASHCPIFGFMMLQMLSVDERSGLQAA